MKINSADFYTHLIDILKNQRADEAVRLAEQYANEKCSHDRLVALGFLVYYFRVQDVSPEVYKNFTYKYATSVFSAQAEATCAGSPDFWRFADVAKVVYDEFVQSEPESDDEYFSRVLALVDATPEKITSFVSDQLEKRIMVFERTFVLGLICSLCRVAFPNVAAMTYAPSFTIMLKYSRANTSPAARACHEKVNALLNQRNKENAAADVASKKVRRNKAYPKGQFE